jgi:hypothetical protein
MPRVFFFKGKIIPKEHHYPKPPISPSPTQKPKILIHQKSTAQIPKSRKPIYLINQTKAELSPITGTLRHERSCPPLPWQ